ncbi:histidine phosphatase family protein [Patescibacteria group bacterium]|nr:histidine phosphatase family protein [Patescibacteria group bacterium]
MPDVTQMTLDQKIDHFYNLFKKEGKNYTKERIKEAIELLSYKHVDPMPKEESDTQPTLYIFRHGQSVDNANFIFSGWRVAPLTEGGEKGALILAEKLKDKKIQMLISSPQQRALKTIKLAMSKNEQAKNLEILPDERIKERFYGDYQGQSKLEMQMENPDKLLEVRRSFDIAPPNGESIKMVCERVADFCDEILPLMKKNKVNVAVSCHGNSIRGFRKYFENISDYETAHLETPLGKDYLAYVIK